MACGEDHSEIFAWRRSFPRVNFHVGARGAPRASALARARRLQLLLDMLYRRHGHSLVFLLLAGLGGPDCGGGGGPADREIHSSVARDTAPLVSSDDAATLASDNLGFAVDLYQRLRTGDGNFVVAPASVSIALAMAYAGAATTTANEIAATMHFSLPPERLHPAFDALDLALTTALAGGDPKAFSLSIANDIWGQKGSVFLSSYLDVLARSYGAGLRAIDFAAAWESARQAINDRVAQETQQQITELLAPGSIDGLTRLVLTDAVFFQGDWTQPFDPNSANGTFHALGGDVSVPMMAGAQEISLWQGAGYSAAALPYVGGTTTMIVVVPDAGTFAAFEAGLTADGAAGILAATSGATLGALTMPRFKLRTSVGLAAVLAAMGMPDAFDSTSADFSGIDGSRDLYISAVVHQATIAVDEKGTTAAAATGVIIGTRGAPLTVLRVDLPFLFFLRHDPTGAILFAGRVVDPSSG
jgi:serpin B